MLCDLLNGVKLGSRYNRTFFEPYNSHCLARQFGLVQGIPLPNDSYAKFDERASSYAYELADWELISNERINNFRFEKFRVAPLATPEFASWWEAMFRKLLG